MDEDSPEHSTESNSNINIDEDSVPEHSTALKSTKNIEAFLLQCIEFMPATGQFRPSSKLYEQVCDQLRSTQRVDVYPAECRRAWKRLQDCYRHEKKKGASSSWPHLGNVAKLKGQTQLFPHLFRKQAVPKSKKELTPASARPGKKQTKTSSFLSSTPKDKKSGFSRG